MRDVNISRGQSWKKVVFHTNTRFCPTFSLNMVNITGLMSTLITANHILSYHNVLDSFGHVSVRNPNSNTTFFIALQLGASPQTR